LKNDQNLLSDFWESIALHNNRKNLFENIHPTRRINLQILSTLLFLHISVVMPLQSFGLKVPNKKDKCEKDFKSICEQVKVSSNVHVTRRVYLNQWAVVGSVDF
jgi:hypothetical protein